jgi:hypothetical protein
MREAFPPCLPITNSSGIENNNNNNNKECNYNHNHHTLSNQITTSDNCHKEKYLNIDRNNETIKEIPNNETEKICFDSDEGKKISCFFCLFIKLLYNRFFLFFSLLKFTFSSI